MSIDKEVKDEIDLKTLVKESSEDYIQECRTTYGDKIRSVFQRIRALSHEIKKLEQQKIKAKEKLDKAVNTIEELKKGNWAILENINKDDGQ